MGDPSDRYHLAALCGSVTRREARRRVAAAPTVADAFAALNRPLEHPDSLERLCAAHGIALLSSLAGEIPAWLQLIPDAPLVMYARGDLGALDRPAVAVVGARRCTRLGAEVAAAMARDLSQGGATVVSGLARGIDAAAHRGALGQGPTVAVLGGGLLNPYPSEHRLLARHIVEGGGLLLTEYPPAAQPRRHHFPERNRLISGLAQAVLVVEAGEHSGSLITARMALEQGREVLAVPGPVTSAASRGCHRLLREGAGLAESAEDVWRVLGQDVPGSGGGAAAPPAPALPGDERLRAVLAAVESWGSVDEVVSVTGLPGEAAVRALVELELGGFVRRVGGGYIRRPP